jgi:NAD(P)-dependent dehydrogenase (short-subunit alcohol dehydrogenase family)
LRLAGKIVLVVGGGQTKGDTIGNGRAAAIVFAREGARVFVADRDLASARETVGLIAAEGSAAEAQRLASPGTCPRPPNP